MSKNVDANERRKARNYCTWKGRQKWEKRRMNSRCSDFFVSNAGNMQPRSETKRLFKDLCKNKKFVQNKKSKIILETTLLQKHLSSEMKELPTSDLLD